MEFLPLVVIAIAFWLLIVRPTARRNKEVRRLQSSLATGDRVILASGIYATLQEIRDDRVLAEVAPGVVVEVARGAIAAVEAPPEPPTAIDPSQSDPSGA